jgi:hypothetical protein
MAKDSESKSHSKSKETEEPHARTVIRMPFFLRYRKLLAIVTIPAIVVLCVFAWNWIPFTEAKYQQEELSKAFFAECYKGFADTAQLPKIPEEALHNAQKKQSLTNDAMRAWSPSVIGFVYKGDWYARITFTAPEKKVFEKKIGPAVNDVGYNTSSERSNHLNPEGGEQ